MRTLASQLNSAFWAMDGPEVPGTASLTFNTLRLFVASNNWNNLLFVPDMLWRWACDLDVTHCTANIDLEELSISSMTMRGHGLVNLGLQFRIALNKAIVLHDKWIWYSSSTEFRRSLTWYFSGKSDLQHAWKCGIAENVYESFRHSVPRLILGSRSRNSSDDVWLPERDCCADQR